MTTDISKLSYLSEIEIPEDEETQTIALDFENLYLDKPKANTVGKYSLLDSFPDDLFKEIQIIPLHLEPNRMEMYDTPFNDSDKKPPACQSINGTNPIVPSVSYQRAAALLKQPSDDTRMIEACDDCPLFDTLCKKRGFMLALAYFPEKGDLLLPIKRNLPTTSVLNFQKFVQKMQHKVEIPEKGYVRLPYHVRLVTLGATLMTGNFPQSRMTFEINGFVPEHIFKEVEKLLPMAKTFAARLATPPARQLTGGTNTTETTFALAEKQYEAITDEHLKEVEADY